jgi:NADH:ubiquinone oxidoreductase subunit 6 (subunit J)
MISGKYIIGAGLIIVLIGTIIYFFGDKLSWIGRLPGDIRIEKENFKLYFPITTLLIMSILLNVIIWLIKKFSN